VKNSSFATGRFTVEHFARSVAAYLLDAGFADQYLHDFITARLNAPEPITLPQLCEAFQAEMLASPRREFEVLLAFTTTPRMPNGVPASWLRDAAIFTWLKDIHTSNLPLPWYHSKPFSYLEQTDRAF
jgi:hypothetical protein